MIVSYVIVVLHRTVIVLHGTNFFYGTMIVLYGTKLFCIGQMFCMGQ